jgi:uncharacterized protein YjbI with pentapeptide repeats
MVVAHQPPRKQRRDITPPRAPHADVASSELPGGVLTDEAGYADLVLADTTLLKQSARDITMERATFHRVRLAGSSLPGAHFRDCTFDACDLAQLTLDRGSGLRIALRQCRLLGLHAADTRFTEAVFSDCAASLALFFGSRFKSARFSNCILTEASFQESDLTGVVFRECDLRQANFHGATLVGADLRGSQVDGLVAGPRELQGVIVDPSQAALLAPLLGLDVRWE